MQVLVIGADAGAIAEQIDPAAELVDPGGAPDPHELAGRLRERPVAGVEAGLLAPISPRYSVRDLAIELGAPVLLAVAASDDAISEARLALEAARGAGLRVIDVVLAGDSHPDDRALLSALADVPVVTFPPQEPWPVEEWLAAPPPPPPGATAARGGATVVLEPYREWISQPVGDPRATARPQIMAAMLEIIAAEGPMLASRAYALYNRASGGRKLTTIARAPLASAVHWLAQERRIARISRDEIPWQDDDVVRVLDAPAIHVRELGPRTLEEVPLDEIAELMRRQRAGDPAAAKRAVLDVYGLKRLTTRADAYLELAVGLSAEDA